MTDDQSDTSDPEFLCSIELLQRSPRIVSRGRSMPPEEFARTSGDIKAVYCAGYVRGMADRMDGLDLAELKNRVRQLESSR